MSMSGSHAAAVDAVDNWVKVSRQGGRLSPSTQLFVEDLVAGRNQERWARANVDQMIPFRVQAPRLLLVVRAGALFLPILLTWLSLSQVIGPFALFLQNQQPSANFLWFWHFSVSIRAVAALGYQLRASENTRKNNIFIYILLRRCLCAM